MFAGPFASHAAKKSIAEFARVSFDPKQPPLRPHGSCGHYRLIVEGGPQ